MKNRGLTQEGLKIIACVTMLIDHIGAVLVPAMGLRLIGRIAFPIYCFLLAEGVAHTRNVKKYGLRLVIGAVLSEVPFDLLLFGRLTWGDQSVMITLLIGYLMALWIRRTERGQLVPVIVCAVAAELVSADYGAFGIMIIALFVMTRERTDRLPMQAMILAALCWFIGGMGWQIGPVYLPAQMFGVLAMIPIGCTTAGNLPQAGRCSGGSTCSIRFTLRCCCSFYGYKKTPPGRPAGFRVIGWLSTAACVWLPPAA